MRLMWLLLLFSPALIAREPVSKAWVADNGDGTYKNPVIMQIIVIAMQSELVMIII